MCLGLMEEEWDIAIILDACRYDTFKEVYRKYLPEERLEKRVGANETIEWLYKNFPKKHYPDVVYVSGHPGINSLGVSWGRFNAKKKFYKVYDAWLDGWDEKIGTTRPEAVREIALKAIRGNSEKRIIIHFMQPHAPYRKATFNYKLLHKRSKLRKKIGMLIDYFEVIRFSYWSIRRNILKIKEPMEAFYIKKYSVEQIKEFYEDNLRWVLNEAKRIIEKISLGDYII